MDQNRIEKQIDLKATVSRVWQALTDHNQFGEWFRVKLNGPFKVGEVSTGHITWPGYEHIKWEVVVQDIEPETYFAFTWHPYAIDPAVDYSTETPTLVEFRLEPVPNGTRLTVTETGFQDLPPHRLSDAFRMNSNGWEQQMKNIEAYVTKA